MTLPPIAHHQCWLGQAAAGHILTSVGEEMESCAEHHYFDKLKGYKSSIKPSVFNTTREISFLQESTYVQHPLNTSLLKACVLSAISLLKGPYQVVNCQDAHPSHIILFLICLLRDKSNTPQEHFAVDNNAATVYLVDTLREDLQLEDFKYESFTDVFVLVNIPACVGRRVWVMKRSGEY